MRAKEAFTSVVSTVAVSAAAMALSVFPAAGPAVAMSPDLPVEVGPGATAQVEHEQVGLDALYAAAGISPEDAGAGVKVGVIDTGIAVYPEGHLLKTNVCFDDAGYPPVTQLGNTRYTNNKVFVARVFTTATTPAYPGAPVGGGDMIGGGSPEAMGEHGSHVAGIIGCNANTPATIGGTQVGQLSGVAPKVLLGSYNVLPGAGLGSDAVFLAQAIDSAVADGMQILNVSLGGPAGYDPAGYVTAALDRAAAAGVVVIVAAGNEGPHRGTISNPGIYPNVVTVGSVTGGRVLATEFSSGDTTFDAPVGDIGAPSHRTSAPLVRVLDAKGKLSVACTRKQVHTPVKDRIMVVRRGVCNFSDKMGVATELGAAGVVIVSNAGQTEAAPSSADGTSYAIPTVVVSLAAGRHIIADASAGRVASFGRPTLLLSEKVNTLSSFSSVGPSKLTGYLKPDVLAPGSNILSPIANYDIESRCATSGTCFAVMSGTSMATPFVTGVAAVLRQAHPDWSATMLASALVHSARLLPAAEGGRFAVGNGLVDPAAAVAAEFGIVQMSVLSHGSGVFTVENPSLSDVVVSFSPSPGVTVQSEVVVPAGSKVDVPFTTAGPAGRVLSVVASAGHTRMLLHILTV